MKLRSVTELSDIYGMRVIVRTSLNVPVKDGLVEDHFRIRRAMSTLEYLIERGARVIILTHIGRDAEASTKPLLGVLKKYIPVSYADGVVGEKVLGAITHMKEGTALLLENVRSRKEEEDNDVAFAKELASYGDFYVNDDFAVSHRAHASVVGIPKHLPSFVGITFLEEYEALRKAFTPEEPSLFILGGAKFETKEPLIEAYSNTYSHTFIGGALANDFIKARGHEVGMSLLSPIDLSSNSLLKEEKILIPSDVIAVLDGGKRVASITDVHEDERILDAGPDTMSMLAPLIKKSKFILWNGPLGDYEEGYDTATKTCAKLIAESNAYSIVGGGDTIASIESLGLQDSFGFLSTAGGAMLQFLEKRTLPGIEALTKE